MVKVKGLENSIVGKLLKIDSSKHGYIGNAIIENEDKTILIVKGEAIESITDAPKIVCDLFERSNPHNKIICQLDSQPCNIPNQDAEKCRKVVIHQYVVK